MQVSVQMVRVLIATIERAGVARERFVDAAGLDERLIEEGTARLSQRDYVRLLEVALEVSGDESFGLHLGQHARSAMFDVVGPLAEQAATLRESLGTASQYARLIAEGHEPELRERGRDAIVRFPSLQGDFVAVRVTAEFVMTALASTLPLFVGGSARPSELCFAYEAPADTSEYEAILGPGVRFGAEFTEMVFPRSWLDRTQPYRNPEFYAVLKTQADRALARLDRETPLSERVVATLEAHGPGPLTMEEVAGALGMSARSLRRRIREEGMRYRDLVARSRMSTAKRLLERPRATVQETAHALGFASPAAFHRAFKRWTGRTPKEYLDSF